jgi:hypothetical protein
MNNNKEIESLKSKIETISKADDIKTCKEDVENTKNDIQIIKTDIEEINKLKNQNINLNNEIKALLLKDDNLIDYLSNISDELIEKISSENIEDIIRRLILFYSINKDNQKNLYKNIMQKMINKKQSSLSKTFLSITKNLISN